MNEPALVLLHAALPKYSASNILEALLQDEQVLGSKMRFTSCPYYIGSCICFPFRGFVSTSAGGSSNEKYLWLW
jgi:hypothetical protein